MAGKLRLLPLPLLLLGGCGLLPANVKDGCYRLTDTGKPLFKIVGEQGKIMTTTNVSTFKVSGWHELSKKSVEVRPAFYIAADEFPKGPDVKAVPSISYTTFPFDQDKGAFHVPLAAWGYAEVKLGAPC